MVPVGDFQALGAVGLSIKAMIEAGFNARQPISGGQLTKVVVVRTNDLDVEGDTEIVLPALSLLLYRVQVSSSLAAPSATGLLDGGRTCLPLDLHYLVTAWADNAEHEHLILGRVAQLLHAAPVLDGLMLHPSGGWAPQDRLELIFEELPLADVMRTFDALDVDYRLSLPYLARVVVLTDPDELDWTEVALAAIGVGGMAGAPT